MIKQIENSKAYRKIEGFKQQLLMKRDNRLKIEEQIVIARNAGADAWQPPESFPPHWAAIVREIANNGMA